MKNNIITKFKEPSTWAGLSILAALFGLPDGLVDNLGQITVAVAAIASIILPEKSS